MKERISRIYLFRSFITLFVLVFLSTITFSCVDTGKREVFFQKGLEKYRAKDFVAAELLFGQASKYDSKHIPTLVMKGKSLFFAGNFNESRKTFDAILTIKEDLPSAVIWLARLDILENKNLVESEKRLLKILATDEENVAGHLILAKLYEKDSRLPESAQQYEMALTYEKELDNSKAKLREIYLSLGLKDRAQRFEAKTK